jgi:hypothetical protein
MLTFEELCKMYNISISKDSNVFLNIEDINSYPMRESGLCIDSNWAKGCLKGQFTVKASYFCNNNCTNCTSFCRVKFSEAWWKSKLSNMYGRPESYSKDVLNDIELSGFSSMIKEVLKEAKMCDTIYAIGLPQRIEKYCSFTAKPEYKHLFVSDVRIVPEQKYCTKITLSPKVLNLDMDKSKTLEFYVDEAWFNKQINFYWRSKPFNAKDKDILDWLNNSNKISYDESTFFLNKKFILDEAKNSGKLYCLTISGSMKHSKINSSTYISKFEEEQVILA